MSHSSKLHCLTMHKMQNHFFLFLMNLSPDIFCCFIGRDHDQSFLSHFLCDTCNFTDLSCFLSVILIPDRRAPVLFVVVSRETIPTLIHLLSPFTISLISSVAFSSVICVGSGSTRVWLKTKQPFLSCQLTPCWSLLPSSSVVPNFFPCLHVPHNLCQELLSHSRSTFLPP